VGSLAAKWSIPRAGGGVFNLDRGVGVRVVRVSSAPGADGWSVGPSPTGSGTGCDGRHIEDGGGSAVAGVGAIVIVG